MDRQMGTGRAVAIIGVLTVVAILALFGFIAAVKSFQRYQKRQDANNRVKVTTINIRNAEQEARVVTAQNATVQARAQQRYLESVGIRRAQDEIAKTLTPLYVQHEAIQAQEKMAVSGKNNTSIYLPSGANGVPLVNDVGQGAHAKTETAP